MKILHHGWNIRNGKNKNLRNKSNKEKNLLTMIFKCTMGIDTHIDDIVSCDTHGICEWEFLPLRVTLWRRRNMRRWAVIIVC